MTTTQKIIRDALAKWALKEHEVANCEEHEPEEAAENCDRCFPYCDAARLALRRACDVLGVPQDFPLDRN